MNRNFGSFILFLTALSAAISLGTVAGEPLFRDGETFSFREEVTFSEQYAHAVMTHIAYFSDGDVIGKPFTKNSADSYCSIECKTDVCEKPMQRFSSRESGTMKIQTRNSEKGIYESSLTLDGGEFKIVGDVFASSSEVSFELVNSLSHAKLQVSCHLGASRWIHSGIPIERKNVLYNLGRHFTLD
ncbi:MAG: hypothetical protein H7301_08210 [Cryobacterium sp.]|nr:hypothetical protein [Oligoflexia bacterium]